MPNLQIPEQELYDERNERFIETPGFVYSYEHSLYAIGKWESKTHRAFMNDDDKSEDDWIFYIKCMSLDDISIDSCFAIYSSRLKEILEYINDPSTATTFSENRASPFMPTTTNEEIYYWMVKFNIPFECEHWNLNRLLTLIRVIGEKENPRYMSQNEIYKQNNELNKARRAAMKMRR